MATRSTIGIARADGFVEAVYCHFDGKDVGAKLAAHHSSTAAAEALIARGSLRSVGDKGPDDVEDYGDPDSRTTSGVQEYEYIWVPADNRWFQVVGDELLPCVAKSAS